MRHILLIGFILLCPILEAQDSPLFTLTDAQTLAVSRSSLLASSRKTSESAGLAQSSLSGQLFPRVSLEAGYRYIAVLPQLPPLNNEFGSHHNYSAGLLVQQLLWDEQATSKQIESLERLQKARVSEEQFIERRVLLETRSAYIELALAQEQMKLAQEALALAKKQYVDMLTRFNAGAASRIDLLNSNQEVLKFSQKILEVETLAKQREVELITLTGPSNTEALEPVANVVKILKVLNINDEDAQAEKNPQLISQQEQAESSRLSAEAASAQRWPLLQAFFKTGLEYPNGPVRDHIWQNTVGASLSMPLLDWGKISNASRQRTVEAQALELRKKNTHEELKRELQKRKIELSQLREKQQLAEKSVKQSSEIASLTETAYRAGKVNFTEVQMANLKRFEAKTELLTLLSSEALSWSLYRSIVGE